MSATQKYVDEFAVAMEHKLDVNRHKGDREGWLKDNLWELVERAYEELEEIEVAIMAGESPQTVLDECADVANFCMMIADKYKEISKK